MKSWLVQKQTAIAKFDSNVAFLQKTKEQIDEEESRALKRINETPAERAAKRKKLDDEVEELKRHLQIVLNDDDVYTEATPLARKVPVIDYEIYRENNKPYFKIKRADEEESEVSLELLRYQSGNGYHGIPPPYTGTFMPPKPDLVFNKAPNDVETDHSAFNVKLSPTKPDQDLSHTNRPSTPIIEDCVSDLEDESETMTPQNVPSFVQSTEQVKSPRPSV
nr:hypothetical protein [Tanacetum cinerariifolium]